MSEIVEEINRLHREVGGHGRCCAAPALHHPQFGAVVAATGIRPTGRV
jgi:hypothetical protein